MIIDRRKILGGIGAAAATSVVARPNIARGAGKIHLTVANGSPLKHVLSSLGTTPWIDRVKELTNGEVEFKYFPGAQLVDLKGLLEAVQNGVADVVPIPMGYVSNKMPLNGVSALPGLGATAKGIVNAHTRALDDGPLRKEFDQNKVYPLYVMAYPPYQLVGMEKHWRTLEDIKGKVLRSAGGTMDLLVSALGATPAAMPAGDMYLALQRGTVDGTISAFASIKGYNIQEIAKSMSGNAPFGTFVNILACNSTKWAALPGEIQDALAQAGRDITASAAASLDASNDDLKAEFSKAGMDIYDFSSDELSKINERIAPVQEDWVKRLADRGLPAADVFARYKAIIGA